MHCATGAAMCRQCMLKNCVLYSSKLKLKMEELEEATPPPALLKLQHKNICNLREHKSEMLVTVLQYFQLFLEHDCKRSCSLETAKSAPKMSCAHNSA